jgi:hypothetical protein
MMIAAKSSRGHVHDWAIALRREIVRRAREICRATHVWRARADRGTARHASCFLLIEGSERNEACMVALNKILVATDFGGPSDSALAYGRELAAASVRR